MRATSVTLTLIFPRARLLDSNFTFFNLSSTFCLHSFYFLFASFDIRNNSLAPQQTPILLTAPTRSLQFPPSSSFFYSIFSILFFNGILFSPYSLSSTFLPSPFPFRLSSFSAPQLSDKSLEETEAEKDFLVRRKLKAIYNKKEADFISLELFNDYEEMVEDYIHNLVTQTEVEKTNEAIQRYVSENSETITMNEFKKVEDLKHTYSSIKTQEDEKR